MNISLPTLDKVCSTYQLAFLVEPLCVNLRNKAYLAASSKKIQLFYSH